MNNEVVERLVRALVVALMNGMLYFTDHRRVKEATEEAVKALDDFFESNPQFSLGLREGMLVLEGEHLYDLSIYAYRLTKALEEHGKHGLRFERGVDSQEVKSLVEILLGPVESSPVESNKALRQKGVKHIQFEEMPLADQSIAGANQNSFFNDQHVSREIYIRVLSTLQDIVKDLRQENKVSFSAANDMAESLVEAIHDHKSSFMALTAIKDYDAYTFNHSVNVCIYATALAESMTTNHKEVVQIAQAALLHDVGKMLIPEEVLFKAGRFSKAEMDIMQQHTVLGAKILVEAKEVSELAVNAAFGHHLRYDQKGYPELSGQITMDPITQLIQVADVYEAVTARRPYKKSLPPEWAADILLKGAGTSFNPGCVEAFLRFFGVFTPGTNVRLDNGALGQVISSNPGEPFRPIVQVTQNPDGEAVEDKLVIDTAERNEAGNLCCSVVESVR